MMQKFLDYIEHLRTKPHHVRRQIAFGAAVAGSSFIALVWFAGTYASGVFAVPNTSFADAAEVAPVVKVTSDQLAGVGAAVDEEGPARIEIIDTTPVAPVTPKPSDQTVLPF